MSWTHVSVVTTSIAAQAAFTRMNPGPRTRRNRFTSARSTSSRVMLISPKGAGQMPEEPDSTRYSSTSKLTTAARPMVRPSQESELPPPWPRGLGRRQEHDTPEHRRPHGADSTRRPPACSRPGNASRSPRLRSRRARGRSRRPGRCRVRRDGSTTQWVPVSSIRYRHALTQARVPIALDPTSSSHRRGVRRREGGQGAPGPCGRDRSCARVARSALRRACPAGTGRRPAVPQGSPRPRPPPRTGRGLLVDPRAAMADVALEEDRDAVGRDPPDHPAHGVHEPCAPPIEAQRRELGDIGKRGHQRSCRARRGSRPSTRAPRRG